MILKPKKSTNTMKKILLLVLMVVGTTMAYGQIKNQTVDYVQASEMKMLTDVMKSEDQNLVFTKNQTAKLERVFFNKAKEIVAIRKAKLGKNEYVAAHTKINQKYISRIEAELTSKQIAVFRKNKKNRKS